MAYYQRYDSTKPAVTILQQVLKTIKLDEALVNENNLILHSFLTTFIKDMQLRDNLFGKVFQEVRYTGSFYSDLRISEPNEFDINIILKLPFGPHNLAVENFPEDPSYVMYRVQNQNISPYSSDDTILTTFFEAGYLMQEKVRRWMQGVVDKTLATYTLPRGVLRISQSGSGPARSLRLHKRSGTFIDVDLVPVFSCYLDIRKPGIDSRVWSKLGATLETVLVPKPPLQMYAFMGFGNTSRCWRTHFPVAENEFLHDHGCVKPIIKLLKLLRDKEDWKILASYYLKTVAMWMLLEYPSKDYWKEDKIGERFVEALQKLQSFVNDRKLPYFFNSSHNLISKIGIDEANNITNRLAVIIRGVQIDPRYFWKIFDLQPTC